MAYDLEKLKKSGMEERYMQGVNLGMDIDEIRRDLLVDHDEKRKENEEKINSFDLEKLSKDEKFKEFSHDFAVLQGRNFNLEEFEVLNRLYESYKDEATAFFEIFRERQTVKADERGNFGLKDFSQNFFEWQRIADRAHAFKGHRDAYWAMLDPKFQDFLSKFKEAKKKSIDKSKFEPAYYLAVAYTEDPQFVEAVETEGGKELLDFLEEKDIDILGNRDFFKYPEMAKMLKNLDSLLIIEAGWNLDGLIEFYEERRILPELLPFLEEINPHPGDKYNIGEFLHMKRLFKYRNELDLKKHLAFYGDAEILSLIENNPDIVGVMKIFPETAPLLMNKDYAGLRSMAMKNFRYILESPEDVVFLNSFVGRYSKNSIQLVEGYLECVKKNTMNKTAEDRKAIFEFADQFRILSPELFAGYKSAKQTGSQEVYISGLRTLSEKMTGAQPLTEKDRQSKYYNELIRSVYPNNVGNWTTYENNDSCADRSQDLTGFTIQPRYEIDLMAGADINLKEGQVLDRERIEASKEKILNIVRKLEEVGYDKEKINAELEEKLNIRLEALAGSKMFQGLDLKDISKLEEKLFLLSMDAVYGEGGRDNQELKEMMTTYEFANFEDARDYIAGTSDRVIAARNQDYALLCELHNFYADRIKEINRRVVEVGWKNENIQRLMPKICKELSRESSEAEKRDKLARLQVDKLGLSDGFVEQLSKSLKKKNGERYSPEQIRRIIHLYEISAGGLQEKSSSSSKKRTKAFYGQLRSQREKTLGAMEAVAGERIDLRDIHLGEINLAEFIDAQGEIRQGNYDDDHFASFTAQRMINLFSGERTDIEDELAKFETEEGKLGQKLFGYITKSKESAHARMVGGVCVSGDNPRKQGEECMWNMPNYLQQVFQDPETFRCQGLNLMHHFEEDGKKILTASFNPSSTYLYSVDEKSLFRGLLSSVREFAQDNDFDLVLVSKNKTIRTNRTGGDFEKEIDMAIAEVGETFIFSEPKVFSHNPKYSLQEMDIIWKK
jgi:hypothetical protein